MFMLREERIQYQDDYRESKQSSFWLIPFFFCWNAMDVTHNLENDSKCQNSDLERSRSWLLFRPRRSLDAQGASNCTSQSFLELFLCPHQPMVELSKRDLMPFAITVSFSVVQVLGEREGRPKGDIFSILRWIRIQLESAFLSGNGWYSDASLT